MRTHRLPTFASLTALLLGCSISTGDALDPTEELGRTHDPLVTTNLSSLGGTGIGIVGGTGAGRIDPGTITLRIPGAQAFVATDRRTGDFVASKTASYSSVRRPIRVTTTAIGKYEVRFENLAGSGGNVIAQAHETAAARCQVEGWSSDGADLVARIACFERVTAAPIASKFVAWYVRGGTPRSGRAELAYLKTDFATASHTPSAAFQYSSAGGNHTVARTGLGRYSVTLANQAGGGGNAHATAFGTLPGTCNVVGWGDDWTNAANAVVDVACFDLAGNPADRLFSLRFLRALGSETTDLQYLYSHAPSAATTTPTRSYAHFASASRPATVRRTSTGVYAVELPGTVAIESVASVTAYGGQGVSCQTAAWSSSGDGVTIPVRCYGGTGALTDSRFVLAYQNGDRIHRALTQSLRVGTPTSIEIAQWEGHLRVAHPSGDGAVLTPVRMRILGAELVDHWYRNRDGSLSKSLVDRDRVHRGVLTMRADGSSHLAVDVDADGIADIVEMVGADRRRRVVVTESVGRAALDAWNAGVNPFCRGTGVDGVVPEDLTAGRILGCPGRHYRALAAGLAAVDRIYPPPSRPQDPFDMLCAEVSAARPAMFDGATRQGGGFDAPLTQIAAQAASEFLRNGFDGQADGAGAQGARTIFAGPVLGAGILLVFVTEAAVAVANVEPTPQAAVEAMQERARQELERRRAETGEGTPTEGEGTAPNGGETTGGTDTGGGTRSRGLPETVTPEILTEACRGRAEGNGARRREFEAALAPQCNDPAASAAALDAVCVGRDGLARVDADGALRSGASCTTDPTTGRCVEPAGMDAIKERFRYQSAGLEGLASCNPIVCRPAN
jgi:hypothetical protein